MVDAKLPSTGCRVGPPRAQCGQLSGAAGRGLARLEHVTRGLPHLPKEDRGLSRPQPGGRSLRDGVGPSAAWRPEGALLTCAGLGHCPRCSALGKGSFQKAPCPEITCRARVSGWQGAADVGAHGSSPLRTGPWVPCLCDSPPGHLLSLKCLASKLVRKRRFKLEGDF